MDSQPPLKPYPSDVSDDDWAFVAPHLTLMRPDARQRTHGLREVSNALQWIVRTGAQWRYLTNACSAVGSGLSADAALDHGRCLDAMVHDLRILLCWLRGRDDQPTATIPDSRAVHSTPENAYRAGYAEYKRK